MQSQFEIAEVLELLGDKIASIGLNTWQLRTFSAIRRCRTSALGGHVDACDGCGNISISYNSCRNRHCPKCQGHKREEWTEKIGQNLLPVPYFHVVFTLPDVLNSLAIYEPKAVYDALFAASWQTLNDFGGNKGVQMGMISILHTWGQTLSLHPHVHCIVPGGGVNGAGEWQNIRCDGKFLFSVKAMSKVFRAKYVAILSQRLHLSKELRASMFAKPWVVYAKRPFGSPKSVVEYLGRYTHKIAISNHRIQAIDKQTVSFLYKDYKQNGQKKTMTLSHCEFVRRFSLHILPKRFVKIRHYGILSSTHKRLKFKKLQSQFKVNVESKGREIVTSSKFRKCPCCKTGNLVIIETFDSRGPPRGYTLGVCQIKSPHNQ